MKFELNNPGSQKREKGNGIAFHIIMHLVDTSGFTICIICLSRFLSLVYIYPFPLDFPLHLLFPET